MAPIEESCSDWYNLDMRKVAVISESANSFARKLCEGVARKAAASYDWELTLLDPENLRTTELDGFDGFIARVNTPQLAKTLKATHKPVVDVFCLMHVPGFAIVASDHAVAGMLAAEHFLQRHFQTFAYCGDGLDYLSRRLKAYTRKIEDAGFKTSTYKVGEGERKAFLVASYRGRTPSAHGNSRLARWLDRLPKPVGIFCAHDLLARQLLGLCRAKGIAVPGEVAVLGCDNDALLCSFGTPALSSLDLNAERIGIRAAEALAIMLAKRSHRLPAFSVHPRGVVTRASTETYPVNLNWLADILRHISEHLSDDLTTASIARTFGRSHTTIEKAFRVHLGTTVRQTVETFRINEAKRLLTSTDDKAETIARRCGYPSAQHFSGLFRRLTGMAPIAYRRSSVTEP